PPPPCAEDDEWSCGFHPQAQAAARVTWSRWQPLRRRDRDRRGGGLARQVARQGHEARGQVLRPVRIRLACTEPAASTSLTFRIWRMACAGWVTCDIDTARWHKRCSR